MKKVFFPVFIFLLIISPVSAQLIDKSAERVKTSIDIPFKKIGSVKPRSTSEIKSSRLTVGCETIDRDLTVWDNYKAYLPPLGVKKIRLQAGWAKCEKVPGTYNWKWLDEIIDYAVANGIEPWLETSYGNPAYKGGGGVGLLNSIMTSKEGYEAWDRWVEALVTRYKDRVKEWEIWNEPDHPSQKISPETTAELNIRTAKIIKRIQPEARIAGAAFASNSNTDYLNRFLKVIADSGKLDLFTWITYHSYNTRPEDSYRERSVMALKKVLESYSSTIKLRQGENGAPSTYIPSFALSEYYWTEYTQAKYDMRRMLGDLGHDIETSVFTMIDIYYKPVLNMKGLIQSDITMTAIRPKVAYYAIQNLASIFDNTLTLNKDFSYKTNSGESISVYAYKKAENRPQLVSLWFDSSVPNNLFKTKMVDISFENVNFIKPVLVDLMTGNIYDIPKDSWNHSNSTFNFRVPLYDSPVLIAEKSIVLSR